MASVPSSLSPPPRSIRATPLELPITVVQLPEHLYGATTRGYVRMCVVNELRCVALPDLRRAMVVSQHTRIGDEQTNKGLVYVRDSIPLQLRSEAMQWAFPKNNTCYFMPLRSIRAYLMERPETGGGQHTRELLCAIYNRLAYPDAPIALPPVPIGRKRVLGAIAPPPPPINKPTILSLSEAAAIGSLIDLKSLPAATPSTPVTPPTIYCVNAQCLFHTYRLHDKCVMPMPSTMLTSTPKEAVPSMRDMVNGWTVPVPPAVLEDAIAICNAAMNKCSADVQTAVRALRGTIPPIQPPCTKYEYEKWKNGVRKRKREEDTTTPIVVVDAAPNRVLF
jgi:hypothetical protein